MSGFSTSVIGLQEARLVALQSYLQGKISDLNTTLQLSPLSLATGSATSSNVIIGDPYTLDDSLKFLICVCGGGGRSMTGMDLESQFKEIGLPNVSTIQYQVHSRILVYVHPDTFPVSTQTVSNVNTQVEKAHRMVCRICDWLRADCFAVVGGVDMTLTSQEYTNTGDNFTMQRITAINLGEFYKGFDGSVRCQGAEVLLTAIAQ